MPRLDLRLHPETDAAVTPWVALCVMQRLVNEVREALGMPLLTEEALRTTVRDLLREARQAGTMTQTEGVP
jgi:hypothetical protein